MENYSFENIRVLVGDPNREVRDAIRGGLYEQGFRYIMVTDRMSVVETAVAANSVDLMICDTELPDGDLYDLVYKIRHHELGDNPFIVVTALIAAPTPKLVKKIFDAGCDDLIPKPISTGLLFERVLNLARNRKAFVVTSDYIGPNRRATPRSGIQRDPEIDVPNPLKAKAVDDASAEDLQAEIDIVANQLNEQKMERHAHRISYLVERIVPVYEDGTSIPGSRRITSAPTGAPRRGPESSGIPRSTSRIPSRPRRWTTPVRKIFRLRSTSSPTSSTSRKWNGTRTGSAIWWSGSCRCTKTGRRTRA